MRKDEVTHVYRVVAMVNIVQETVLKYNAVVI